MQFTMKEVELYMLKQWELIAGAVKCKEPLRPTIVHDAFAEIVALEEIVERMKSVN